MSDTEKKHPQDNIVPDLVQVLQKWRDQKRPLPEMMPKVLADAARWWITMQEPPLMPFELPRQARVVGDDSQRWEFPYIRRLCITLSAFLRQTSQQQRIIVAAREDGIRWRGEDAEHFALVIAEMERQQQMGTQAYREYAVKRMKAKRVGKGLPYDKGKRYGR